jgi:iron complex outermembrane receptor protein
MNQMSRCFPLLLITGGMLFLSGLASAQETGSITGVVQVSGTIVRDAEVRIRELGLRVAVGEDGSFSFEDVRPGEYVLQGESPRWGNGSQNVNIVSGVNTSVVVELQAIFHMGELLVTTVPGTVRQDRAYQATTVVTSRELLKLGESTLGETLSKKPGLSSTYFGPGSSRPIIRGLGGDRVKMLQNGLELGDASGTSPDHAVSVEPRLAEQIEVVRGPAALLYGSSAVGGVVNVLDAAIARDLPSKQLSGFLEGLGGTVSDERTGSLGLTSRLGNLVLTGSGVLRRAEDFSIPGYATKDADHREEHETLGVMPNSSLEGQSGTLGASLVGSQGYFGVSVFDQWSNYGVPGHARHEEEGHDDHDEEEHEEEGVRIDLDRSRINLEGGLRFQGAGFSSGFENVTLNFAQNDYIHEEIEEDAVHTTFTNKSYEGRIESDHALSGRVSGSIGISFYSRDFRVVGEEAFVPNTETKNKAIFLYENVEFAEELGLQIGSRIEQQDVKTVIETLDDRTFEAFSNSMGLKWSPLESFSFVLSASRSAKLPNAEELFSNGPHLATGSFEIGNSNLEKEKVYSVDGTLNYISNRFRTAVSLYNNDFKNYIYLAKEDDHDDDHENHKLPEYHYSQTNAKFEGFEFESEYDFIHGDRSLGSPHLSLGFMADAVVGKLLNGHDEGGDNYVPRLPPYRIGGSLSYSQGLLSSDVAVRYSGRQGKVTHGEEITEAFTMADASITYRLFSGNVFHDVSLVVNNLTNVDARLHQSFQKNIAPLPGREVRLIYRMNF